MYAKSDRSGVITEYLAFLDLYARSMARETLFPEGSACVYGAGETDLLDTAPKVEKKIVFPRRS